MIAFNYRPDYHGQRTLRALDRSLGRMHGAIPDQYQVPLADLEPTLDEWRPLLIVPFDRARSRYLAETERNLTRWLDWARTPSARRCIRPRR